MTTIREIYEESFKREYDSIPERDMEHRIGQEIKDAIHERLTSLGLKHPKEYDDAIDDHYDYAYEATIENGLKMKVDIQRHLLPDVNIEDTRFEDELAKMSDEEFDRMIITHHSHCTNELVQ